MKKLLILIGLFAVIVGYSQNNLKDNIGEYVSNRPEGTIANTTDSTLIMLINNLASYQVRMDTLAVKIYAVLDSLGYSLGGSSTDDQTLSFDGTSISIEDGNSVDISAIDTDTDTQLNESQVEAFIDGDETSFDGWDKDASNDFDGDFTSLANIPSGLSDGDDAGATAKGVANVVNVSDGSADLQSTNLEIDNSGSSIYINNTLAGSISINGSMTTTTTLTTFVQPVRLSTSISDGTPTALQVNATGDISTLDFDADEMVVVPTGNLAASDVQAALEELQTDIDGISSASAVGASNEVQRSDGSGNFEASGLTFTANTFGLTSGSTADFNFNLRPSATNTRTLGTDGRRLSEIHTNQLSLNGFDATDIHDEDDLSSDDASALATQQSIKAYVDNSNFVPSNTAGITGATAITNIVQLSQTDYNAIGSPDTNTLYIIND